MIRFSDGSESEKTATFQMMAMVDVVFTLLSFFVLASQFTMPERDFDLGYREARLAVGAQAADFPTFVSVIMRNRGTGSAAISIGQAALPDDDYAAITRTLAEINMPTIPVLIQADPTLTVDQVARAMDAALGSPMKKVSVSTLAVKVAGPPSR